MAITQYPLTSSGAFSFASYNTASISPTANRLQFCVVASNPTTYAVPCNVTSITGCGLTWVHVTSINFGANGDRLSVFRAMGAAPTTGALTISLDATTTSCMWQVMEFAGVDTTGTNGSGAVVQWGTSSTTSAGTSASTALNAFASANNATFGAFDAVGVSGSVGNISATAGIGFTQIYNVSSTEWTNLSTEWRADNSVAVGETFSPAADVVGCIGIEIAAGIGGGGGGGGTTSSIFRNPYVQPFAVNSIWNMPIGSSATFSAANLATAGATEAPVLDYEHIIQSPTAPLINVYYSSVGWPTVCSTPTSGTILQTVPVPSSYTVGPDGGNDGSTFLGPDYRTIQQNQPFSRCTVGANGTAMVAPSLWTVDFYGAGIYGAHGGSDLSSIGGSLRVGELRPNQTGPAHAIKLNINSGQLWSGTPGFLWPANNRDSGSTVYSGTNSNLQMGSLLAIPPSVTLASLALQTSLAGDNTKGPGAQLFWTLQNYGLYIVDSTASSTTPSFGISIEASGTGPTATGYTQGFEAQFFNDWGYGPQQWGAGSAWANDFLLLMSTLQAVTNNTSTTIGGGGAPRVALAAPLSATFAAEAHAFNNSATSLNITVPSYANGNVLVASIGTSGNAVISAPAGWTLIANTSSGASSADAQQSTYWRVASSEPTSYTWALGATAVASNGFIWAIKDANTSSPIHVSSTNIGSGTAITANAVTTTDTNTLLLYLATNYSAATAWPANTLWTQHNSTTASTIQTIGNTASLYDTINTGNFVTNVTSGGAAGDKWAVQLIALAPSGFSGVVGTMSPGTVAPFTATPLAGKAGTGSVGSVQRSNTNSITGAASAGTPGNITGGQPIAGVVATGAIGAAIPLAMGGVVGTVRAGFLLAGQLASGVAATTASGTITGGQKITGAAATSASGTVIGLSDTSAFALTGNAAAGSVGIMNGVIAIAADTLASPALLGGVTTKIFYGYTIAGIYSAGAVGIASEVGKCNITLIGLVSTTALGTDTVNTWSGIPAGSSGTWHPVIV